MTWNGNEHTEKALKYKSLKGISEQQLAEHHDKLYVGYVKKINAIREMLKEVDLSTANATYSNIRELKVEETFAQNGVRLHEGYFELLGGDGNPEGTVVDLIKKDFGSYENWEAEFKAMGLSSRGWVVLAYDWEEKKLRNYLCDVHNQGGVWDCTPVLILDVYEHAYFIDFATGRKGYIDAFMGNIDWKAVDENYKEKVSKRKGE